MEKDILETLSNNRYSFATFTEFREDSVYLQSIVTLPGPDVLKNTYYVIFKVPVNSDLFKGFSYKEVPFAVIKDYYFKIIQAQPIGKHNP